MMNKPYNTGQPEWEKILRSLEQGDEVSEDRFKKLSVEEIALIAEIKHNQRLKEAVASLDAIDLKADWDEVKDQLNTAPGKGRIVYLTSRLMRYAAILILPIMIIGGGYFALKRNQQMLVSNKTERRGFKKATLILGDGRSVELGANQSIKNSDGAQISANAAHDLVYRRTEQNMEALPIYNTLIIPKGGEYKLILADGTDVWVNADTRIKYQVNFDATKTREVFLERGEAYFKVAKNPNKPFIVRNGDMKVQVLGTSFNVNAYSDNIQTTLVEGKVKESLNNGKAQVELTPGQQANFKKADETLEKQDVDVYPFVAWKDGVLAFENETMVALMDQIGRLYDYDIEFKDESLKQLHYSGSTDKSEDVQDLLNIIQKTSKLKFSIKERSIIVEKLTKK